MWWPIILKNKIVALGICPFGQRFVTAVGWTYLTTGLSTHHSAMRENVASPLMA